MIEITHDYIKNNINKSIKYCRYYATEITSEIISEIIIKNSTIKKTIRKNKGKHNYTNICQRYIEKVQVARGTNAKTYFNIPCGFDIETTRVSDELSFMYVWQFSLFDNVIMGDSWEQFIIFINLLKNVLQYQDQHRIIVWVANLGYEWQFMKHYLNVTDYFFKERREPITIEHDNFIIFKECLSWGGSLKKLANDYTDLIKLTGDLDYSVYRESYTDFKYDNEFKYCDFDVLILSHFSIWFFNTYYKLGYNPVTVQSVLRQKMKNDCSDLKEQYNKIRGAYPLNRMRYDILMNWVYRGGYTHASNIYIDELITEKSYDAKLYSVDFTSSYPASMLHFNYPYMFNKLFINTIDRLEQIDTTKYGWYGLFVFKGLKATTPHSIESKNKCVRLQNEIIDNGRVQRGDIAVYLTNLDYESYKEFYTWDSIEFTEIYVSKLKPLPRYLIDGLCEYYTKKAELKNAGEPYAIEKTYVNSYYGMSVTRLIFEDILLKETEITTEPNKISKDFEKAKDKKLMLPQWGVWVAAYSRRELLKMVYKLEKSGNPALYMDTDSIKFLNMNDGLSIINSYNEQIEELNSNICKRLGLDQDIFFDLGCFDNEYPQGLETFKTLGAKRYLYTYKDKNGKRHYNCTIAGLPKNEYYKLYGDNLTHFYKAFRKDLIVHSCKLASKYVDEEQTHINRDGSIRIVKSCLVLNDIDFQMYMDISWLYFLHDLKESIKEKRKY